MSLQPIRIVFHARRTLVRAVIRTPELQAHNLVSSKNCKGVKSNNNFGQITGIQEKLDTTCKQNASKQITQGNETLLPNRQKESWQTFEETSGYLRLERANKWPNSMTDMKKMMNLVSIPNTCLESNASSNKYIYLKKRKYRVPISEFEYQFQFKN